MSAGAFPRPKRKLKLATVSLAGCFGCHMSLLDIDERLFDLLEHVELDRSPLTDIGVDAKEGDFIETLFIASTKDYLMFFTNLGRCYWQKVYDIPNLPRQSKGRSIANLLEMMPGEKLAEVLAVRDFEDEGKTCRGPRRS